MGQEVVRLGDRSGLVLPLTDVPGPGQTAEVAPRVLGLLFYENRATLAEAEMEFLLSDIRAMGPRGPIVGVDLTFVEDAELAQALGAALAARSIAPGAPLFEIRDASGSLLGWGIMGLGLASVLAGTIAALALRPAAPKVPERRGTHYHIAPYAPPMVAEVDAMAMLRKVLQPLSAADRPIEVYTVAPHEEPAEDETDQALADAALIEAFAAEGPEDTANPAEEVQAAVRAAEERRRAETEAALAKAKAEAEANRPAAAEQQSEDEALSILSKVVEEVGEPQAAPRGLKVVAGTQTRDAS